MEQNTIRNLIFLNSLTIALKQEIIRYKCIKYKQILYAENYKILMKIINED